MTSRRSTKETIVDAAAAILNEFGLDAVTIRNVADASNYGRSTVTHHFSDKEALLDALHILAVNAFAEHITTARFSAVLVERHPSQAEFVSQLASDPQEDAEAEVGPQILLRFRASYPGYWNLLRFRQCPDFTSEDAPLAHQLMIALCGDPLEGPIGLTVDVILHQLFALHEWAAVANPAALMRLLHREPSLNYWLAVFGDAPGTTS